MYASSLAKEQARGPAANSQVSLRQQMASETLQSIPICRREHPRILQLSLFLNQQQGGFF